MSALRAAAVARAPRRAQCSCAPVAEPADPLVAPHGGRGLTQAAWFDDDGERDDLAERARSLRAIELTPREAGDVLMMGIGAYSPLTSFVGKEDWQSVCERMTLKDGTFWPLPVTLGAEAKAAAALRSGEEVALTHAGETVAVLTAEGAWAPTDAEREAELDRVYRSRDEAAHAGARELLAAARAKPVNVAGRVRVLADAPGDVARPEATREHFRARGWKTVAALGARNVMHRAQEHLARLGVDACDGLFVYSPVGVQAERPGDLPSAVRRRCIDALLSNHLPTHNVLQAGYPAPTRYAGPREALLQAVTLQNYGCSHMIVGPNHAAVGKHYGTFDAQFAFDEVPRPEGEGKRLLIAPIKTDIAFFCAKCEGTATMRTCPHSKADRVLVSGADARAALSEGRPLPEHFSRPEVLAVLREHYEAVRRLAVQ